MASQLGRRGLARLALRRPGLRGRLVTFDDPSGEFEALCSAYEEACCALEGWRQSSAEYADLRVAEYQQLVADLESDLMQSVTSTASR